MRREEASKARRFRRSKARRFRWEEACDLLESSGGAMDTRGEQEAGSIYWLRHVVGVDRYAVRVHIVKRCRRRMDMVQNHVAEHHDNE